MGIGAIKQSKLIKFIEANGFYKKRQQGSHATYRNDKLSATVVIPVGRKDAHPCLILKVRKALKMTYEEFEKKLKDF
jgi:predicted RNA binding protein YcfA (HicA-like mRNA interferase family)